MIAGEEEGRGRERELTPPKELMSLIPGAFLTVGRGHRRDWSERGEEVTSSVDFAT